MLITVYTGGVTAYRSIYKNNKSNSFQVDHELWTLPIQPTMSGSQGLLATGLGTELVIMMMEMEITNLYWKRFLP